MFLADLCQVPKAQVQVQVPELQARVQVPITRDQVQPKYWNTVSWW